MNKDKDKADAVAQGTPSIYADLISRLEKTCAHQYTEDAEDAMGEAARLIPQLEREVAALSAQREEIRQRLAKAFADLTSRDTQIYELSAQVVELQKEKATLAEYRFMYESCSK